MSYRDPTPELRLVDEIDVAVAEHARVVASRALDPEELDDRFDEWPSPSAPDRVPSPSGDRFVAVLAAIGGVPAGYLGGPIAQGRARLDALVAETEAPEALLGAMLAMIGPRLGGARVDEGIDEGIDEGVEDGVEVWARPARSWHEAAAAAHRMTELRALHQMRCKLPVDVEPLPTRSYRPDDLEALLVVNNRAFASLPDQGGQTAESLLETMEQPWFRPDGLRLHERDGRLVGFCWTKIHPSPPAVTELGEIYVIGVDPDYHGRGLGGPMTAAGLAWLSDQGISTGMLYVEADNIPAIRTYERLGFIVLRTDRAWTWVPTDVAR